MIMLLYRYCLRLGVINQARKVGTSTISLIRYARISPVDKEVRIIKVALYYSKQSAYQYLQHLFEQATMLHISSQKIWDKINAPKIDCKALLFFLLRMLVNTCEKK